MKNKIMKATEIPGCFSRVEVQYENGSRRSYKPEKVPKKVREWMFSREVVVWDYFGVRTYTRGED